MGSKVLLADDSVTIQKVVAIIFANEDYELQIVGNGDTALQKARETRPDVMLVDALMPGKNGYEVCQEIRRDPSLQHISLLLMTGAFDAVDEEKKRLSGADEFITKPFESQSVLDVTARLIALSRERARNMPPQQAAAAPQPVAVAPAAAPAAVIQTPPVDDIWGDFSAEVDQAAPTPDTEVFSTTISSPVAAAPAPVAAKKDDDLWGVFDMDAIDVGTPAIPGAGQGEPTVTTVANDDYFDFAASEPEVVTAGAKVEEFVLDEIAAPAVNVPQTASSVFDSYDEFDLGQPAAEPVSAPVMEESLMPSEEDFSTISFDEPEQAAPVAATPPPASASPPLAPPVIQAAPVSSEPLTAPAPLAPVAVTPPQPVAPAAPGVAAPVSLDDEKLKELLSKVSRDVIERIVWEVVPDLAESIIREEIRKIKEGIGR